MFALVGTAIGAGILYLPLEVGREGFWALLLLAPVVFLLILLAHRQVARMLLLGRGALDYTGVVSNQLGSAFGLMCTLIFLLTFFAVLASYSIGLNSNLGDFLHYEEITATNWADGPFLSLLLLGGFLLLNLLGQRIVLRLMSVLSAGLIVALLLFTLYFIPHWSFEGIFEPLCPRTFLSHILLLLPILTFSFVFFPAMPSMLADLRDVAGGELPKDAGQIMSRVILKAAGTLFVFILLFVIATVLLLSTDEVNEAVEKNINCLSMLSHREDISPEIAHFGVFIGLAALLTSFAGVFFAVRDCITDLVRRLADVCGLSVHVGSKHRTSILISIMLTMWLITILNPSVLDAFGYVIAPLVAIFIFIIPIAIELKRKGRITLMKPAYAFILVMGLAVLIAYALGTLLSGA